MSDAHETQRIQTDGGVVVVERFGCQCCGEGVHRVRVSADSESYEYTGRFARVWWDLVEDVRMKKRLLSLGL